MSNASIGAKFSLLGAAAVGCLFTASAEIQSGQLLVKSVQGRATYTSGQAGGLPLKSDLVLGSGTVLRTEDGSTADLVLRQTGTVLRMMPGTVIELASLDAEVVGENVITETSINLKSGGIIGSQRKLSKPSKFDITMPGGVATIRGTEYLCRADGLVSCFSGAVSVNYGSSRQGASSRVEVPAGFSADPATRQVVATTPASLASLAPDVNAVRDNAKACNLERTPVESHDGCRVSPTNPDHDHMTMTMTMTMGMDTTMETAATTEEIAVPATVTADRGNGCEECGGWT